MDLLIATHNPAKKQELREAFLHFASNTKQFNLLFLDDLDINNDPEETGKTFEENALFKAKYFASLSHLPTVADDGGIEIDALSGEPGIHSKRWLGKPASDDELVEYTLRRLSAVPLEKRTAHFRIALCYFNPLKHISFISTASLDGRIALLAGPKSIKGFPYRSLFIVDKYKKYYDELTHEEHLSVNHRLHAVQNLIKKI